MHNIDSFCGIAWHWPLITFWILVEFAVKASRIPFQMRRRNDGESIRVTQVFQIFPTATKSGMLFFTCEIINVCLYFPESCVFR